MLAKTPYWSKVKKGQKWVPPVSNAKKHCSLSLSIRFCHAGYVLLYAERRSNYERRILVVSIFSIQSCINCRSVSHWVDTLVENKNRLFWMQQELPRNDHRRSTYDSRTLRVCYWWRTRPQSRHRNLHLPGTYDYTCLTKSTCVNLALDSQQESTKQVSVRITFTSGHSKWEQTRDITEETIDPSTPQVEVQL